MNYKAVTYILGKIALIEGALLLLPMLVSFYYQENLTLAFSVPMLLLIFIGIALTVKKPQKMNIFVKEGLVICSLAWILMSLFGALPFVISDTVPNYVNACFETVSGFTTTGSTVMTDIESAPKSVLFWRSFTHWIGGMGILSFMIAVIPKGAGHSMFIMKAEVPGPKAGKVASKLQNSARILYIIYGVMTLLEILFLFAGGMRLYDSVVTAFSTAGTGGFAVKNASISSYHSSYFEYVISAFMFLFGINFNLYFFVIIKNLSAVFRDEEFRAYLIFNILSVAAITANLYSFYGNLETAFRNSLFNVNSIMSTTGFTTEDFNTWPTFSKVILLTLMFAGCSAGSTGGGIKVSRIVLYFKQMACDFQQMIRPHAVIKPRMNGKIVENAVVKGVNSYFTAYMITFFISVILISLNGFDPTTTLTSVIACFNNIGPGLGAVGPTGNFLQFSVFSKIILMFDMLAGRLELFPILLLFAPNTWKKSK